jgi:hypothetical protein
VGSLFQLLPSESGLPTDSDMETPIFSKLDEKSLSSHLT